MTSTDVEIFKSGLEDLKYYIDGRVSEVEKRVDGRLNEVSAEIRTVNENVLVNSAKIDAYRDFMSIGFTILTLIIGFFGFLVTVAPMLREMYREAHREKKEPELTKAEVEVMITEAISRIQKS